MVEKLGRPQALKALVVVAAFLTPIAVAAGVSREPVLESPRALVVALGAAWVAAALVGYGFYGGKRCLGAATLLTVAALVIIVGYARPWVGEGVEENVVFWYAASFTYESSVDNFPIENVALGLPCPNIDNKFIQMTGISWALYGITENESKLQIQDGRVVQLLGDRTVPPVIQFGWDNTIHGPKIAISVNKLYPSETISFTAYSSVSRQYANSVTLYENKDNKKIYSYWHSYPLDRRINYLAQAHLFRLVNNDFRKVEGAIRKNENAEFGWWRLYPENTAV
jgi:hypothetical protein